MITIPGKIPICIQPLFWLFAGFIGFLYSGGSFVVTLIWVLVIFFSVLVHEYGHALTAYFFGKKPRISLVALGGVTSYETTKLSLFRQFLIVLNGPLAGFTLALAAYFLFKGDLFSANLLRYTLQLFFFVNVFWTIINLLPILPLDGGQLLRIVLEAIFGHRGTKIAFFIGMVLAAIFGGFFFLNRRVFIGAIFFLFGYESYQSWKQAKNLSAHDRSEDLQMLLMNGEKALIEGNQDEAIRAFEEITRSTKEGVLFKTASQYLGLLYYNKGEKKKAYEWLLPMKDSLSMEGTLVMHDAAFIEKDYVLVAELSAECFRLYPRLDVALRNAKAFGFLGKGKFAGGWLQSASNLSDLSIPSLLEEEAFQNVKKDPEFQAFIKKIV